MRLYLPLLLSTLLLMASHDGGATGQRHSRWLTSLTAKFEQFKADKKGKLIWAASTVLALAGVYYLNYSQIVELEQNYRQREIFLQAIVRGDKDTVTAQLELEDFPLERYLDLTIHYQVNGEHRLGVVESVDPTLNALRIADSGDFIAKAAIEGVLLLDSGLQGRVALFYLRHVHLLQGDRKEIFGDKVSGFGTVAGVTSGGYLIIRPYVGRGEGYQHDAFADPLLLIHQHNLSSIP